MATEAVEEVLDGTRFEMERCGDGRSGLVLQEEALPDLLTQRHRQGLWHGAPREEEESRWAEVNIARTRSCAKLDVALTRKTGCRINAQNLMSRDRGRLSSPLNMIIC
jgi:hypothetical protein